MRQLACGFLAALVTPIIILVSTANSRYLANQNDFGRDVSLLLPYVVVALFASVIGTILYLLSARGAARLALWCYYLAGPFYLAYRALRKVYWTLTASTLGELPELITISALVCVFCSCLLVIWKNRASPRVIVTPLALVGFLFAINEGRVFLQSAESARHEKAILERPEETEVPSDRRDGRKRMPNIYHIVLDGYQTDMFDFAFEDDDRRKELGGFVQFENNTTVYGRTSFSVPSTFYGKPFDSESSQLEYVSGHFDSIQSFLYALRKNGYKSYGFPVSEKQAGRDESLLDFSMRLSDHVVVHQPRNRTVFRQFWLATCFPRFVSRHFVSSQEYDALIHGSFTPADVVIKAWLSFQQYLRMEEALPDSNRYTFLHLMLPHPPMILHCDCSVPDFANDPRDYNEAYVDQIMCAKKVISEFLQKLKELNRYEDSLILLHGDHGFYAIRRGDRLYDLSRLMEANPENVAEHTAEFVRTRSRALLLLKLPGARSPCRVSTAQTTLLDIAPTILDAVGISAECEYPGVSLVHPERVPDDRTRFYHFHDFVTVGNVRMLAEEMTRWIIKGDSIVLDETIDLKHTLSEK